MFALTGFNTIKSSFLQRPTLGLTNLPILQQQFGKRYSHELAPRFKKIQKAQKGRIPVRTGGSIKGSTLKFGTYGLRLKSEGVRLKAIHLKEADVCIMRMMRPIGGKLWRRLSTNIAICIKGNETRMGKGKGAFDHWAVRVPTGKILFEIAGAELHEKVAREAFRKAATKLPGLYEVVTIDHKPRVGLDAFKDEKDTINYFEEAQKKPSKELLNKLKSQEEMYKLYKGR